MHILHITPSYYPATYWGGPIFSVYELNNSLASLPEVALKVLTTDSAGPSIKDRLNVGALDVRSLYPKYDVHFYHRVGGHSTAPNLLTKLTGFISWADVVHLTATYSFPTIPTLLFCRIGNKPVVWSPRGALLELHNYKLARKKVLKRVWNAACNFLVLTGKVTLHTTSEAERIASQSQIPKAGAVVIRNGVNAPLNPPRRGYLRDGKLRLLFIGRLHPIKGIENLLEALKLLNDPSITLSVCGDGDPQYVVDLKEQARQLHYFEKGIQFRGNVGGELKTAAFLNSDVCVIPSFSENSALVVMEALSHGVPVIASRGTPWQDIGEKHCGLWVDNDPAALADAIRSIRQQDLAEMGYRGWRWMRDEFGWDVIGSEMLNLYKSVCS